MSHLGASVNPSIGDSPINATLVVAIDFGTTFSGYAFSFKSNKDNIRMYRDWGTCVGIPTAYKAPTCVLTDKHGRFVAFGYEAQTRYSNLLPEEAGHFNLYEKFKMHLHAKKLRSDSTITSSSGKIAKAQDVFAMVLKYLKQHVFKTIKIQTGSAPSEDDIQWVVTVPAIWSDAAKQFMRETAHKAGLTKYPYSHQLIIALEPEAASLYCRQMDLHMPSDADGRKAKIQPGTQYLVLDCGGGTLDITAHELNSDMTISELCSTNGGDLGGSQVDKNFIALLEEICGKLMLLQFRIENPADWLQMMVNFERLKRSTDPQNRSLSLNIQLSYEFVECYNKNNRKAIKDLNYKGVRFASGMLRIPYDVMEELFTPVVDNIVKHVKDLLKKPALRQVSIVLLVGGFGESPVLQNAIRDKLRLRQDLLVPPEASLCVVKGAVLFGHQPADVAERVARKTYGSEIGQEYDPLLHTDPSKTIALDDGTKHAVHVFEKWITKGDKVKTGEKMSFETVPRYAFQSKMTFYIYQTDKRNPGYTDEEDVDLVAKFRIDLPGAGVERGVNYSITFGGTEIEVEAWDPRPGGDRQTCKVDFLSY